MQIVSLKSEMLQAWKLAWYAKKTGANVVTFDYRGFGDSLCPKVPFAVCPTEVGNGLC